MNCANCGAPLPPKSNICQFCQTVNDVDLRAIGGGVKGPQTNRACPRCTAPMISVCVHAGEKLYIERCRKCLGIFFDPGELDGLLDASVTPANDVDYHRLQMLVEQERQVGNHDDTVKYIKCPVCLKLMNRRSYGARAGVIVDECRDHGVWLDGGELGQLFKWMKAGGRELDQQRKIAELKEAERQARRAKQMVDGPYGGTGLDAEYRYARPHSFEGDLLVGTVRMLISLFR